MHPQPVSGESTSPSFDPAAPVSLLFVATIALAAATGGLLFGFDTAVISGTQRFFEAEFRLDDAGTGWVVSSVLIGCMIGAALSGPASDRFGRRKVLLLAAGFFFASALACAVCRTANELVFARLVGGIGVGIASMISPLYIAEVSPPRVRGRLVALQQLAIVIGILVAYFTNTLFLQADLDDAARWRGMLAIAAVPSAGFFLLLLPIPESPRWLVQKGRRDQALAILARIAGPQQAQLEIAQIEAAVAEESGSWSELFQPRVRQALGIGIVLAILQQVTGINAILYFAPKILEASGAAAESAFNDTVLIGLTNLVFTFVGIALVDRLGRKPLLIVGVGGMGLTLVSLSTAFARGITGMWLLVPILAYVACFAASTGIVTWVIISEIYPTRVRGRAMSIAVVALWIACYALTLTFPILLNRMGAAFTFMIYACLCLVTVLFVARFVPETRNRSLEEIERSWK